MGQLCIFQISTQSSSVFSNFHLSHPLHPLYLTPVIVCALNIPSQSSSTSSDSHSSHLLYPHLSQSSSISSNSILVILCVTIACHTNHGAPCCTLHLAPPPPACACRSGQRQCNGPDCMVISCYHLVARCSALGVAPDDLCQEASIL